MTARQMTGHIRVMMVRKRTNSEMYMRENASGPIILTANSEQFLNQQIDSSLKQGYLIKDAMYRDEQGQYCQKMVQPNNIDGELTRSGFVKLIIFLPAYFTLLFYILNRDW